MQGDPIVEAVLTAVETSVAYFANAAGVECAVMTNRVFGPDGQPAMRVHASGRVWKVRVEEAEL
ncbi:hypothetical protein NUH86_10810 [Sphingobium sp. JS3065]|uniref:hypothetical protein n=1 Tax=Sphingobium sp. JS3065 TaxID=2970925 RepID=UPI0022643DD6|nr:hypothetical protein [Sphingobium sp. JS3065]UZW54025.1 hypothetical protein NUH86_10810 [Sphingobium sp. JS3065]